MLSGHHRHYYGQVKVIIIAIIKIMNMIIIPTITITVTHHKTVVIMNIVICSINLINTHQKLNSWKDSHRESQRQCHQSIGDV